MAVQTILAKDILRGPAASRQSVAAVGNTGMEGRCVTLLTQRRPPGRQQALMNRAMWPVAKAAVLGSRRVLPQEGTAFFLVAAKAVVVQRHLVQSAFTEAAVGIMAIHAGGFAFSNRVVRGEAQLGSHLRYGSPGTMLLHLTGRGLGQRGHAPCGSRCRRDFPAGVRCPTTVTDHPSRGSFGSCCCGFQDQTSRWVRN